MVQPLFTKGQLISMGLFGVFNSFKKRTKKRKNSTQQYYTSVISQVEFFCSFFGRIEDTIVCFRDLLTFKVFPCKGKP